MKFKKNHIIVFIVFVVLSSASVSLAGNRAVWIEGNVTQTPFKMDSHYVIKVDNVFYEILQKDIMITYRYLRGEGAYTERNVTIDSISIDQKIMMKVWKKEVIQIILF